MQPLPQLMARCRGRGVKLTPQRLAIFEYLSRHPGHPTAEEVYRAVLARYPTLSFATVYKTLELLAEMGAEVVHPVAVRRARRGRMLLVVRALEDEAPQTVVRPSSRDDGGVLMLAVDQKERMARISLVGPASMTPEVLPLPAHGEGAFDEGGLRVVWAEVPVASAAVAAQRVHAAIMDL